MSDAFECDRCGFVRAGQPAMQIDLGDLCEGCAKFYRKWVAGGQ